MAIYEKNSIGIKRMTELENAAAAAEKNAADTAYIAMMTGIDIPEPETSANNEEESNG